MVLTGGLAVVALGGAATGYYVAKRVNDKKGPPQTDSRSARPKSH